MLFRLEGDALKDQQPDNRLLRDAFDLVVAAYEDPKREPELAAWRRRSLAHERAAAQAEAKWEVMGRVEDVPLSRLDALKLAIQVRLARLSESSVQPFAVLSVAAALIAAVYLSLGHGFQSQPLSDAAQVRVEEAAIELPEVYRTRRGQQRTVLLEDGSEVWLDWQTELTVVMTDSEREVQLRKGRALFKVVSDADRPFSVVSDDAVATVIGTEFVVYRLDGQTVEIEVLEGAVRVQPENAKAATRLGAADVLRITEGEVGRIRSRPLAEIGSWRDGILVFEQRPLIEALEALEPYTSYQIDARHVFDSNRPVSGTFLLSKGDAALRAIMQSYQLTGEVRGQNTLELRSLASVRPR
ncbi:MAG: FecR domain-containing protein [Pseudomonadota bacterium]